MGPGAASKPPPTLRLGDRTIPIDLPNARDPRLHIAAVILTLHVLGQVGLGFAVSVPQIVAAILTCAVIEAVVTWRQTGRLAWPASAILTGSGVALIFRVLETTSGDHWSLTDWHLFAVVAGGSLVTKYVIRYRGGPLFNPSNVGLVAAFLVLGIDRAEPLDFWWGPMSPYLVTAYAVILFGGVIVTRRLGLLSMASAFWVTFVAGIGLLAASSHCITARWSFEPVCDGRFFTVVAFSPEVLVFLFFMITDPRSIPGPGRGRVWFAVGVAVLSLLLIAPQTTEFGAKVGLLGGLVLMTAARPLFDRLGELARLRPHLAMASLAAAPLVAIALWMAGAPARTSADGTDADPGPVEITVDLTALPEPIVHPEVTRLDPTIDLVFARGMAEALATCLATEAEAVLSQDAQLLAAVSTAFRLDEMERVLADSIESGMATVSNYQFESLRLVVTHPYGPQGGAYHGFEGTGTTELLTVDLDTGTAMERDTGAFVLVFSMELGADGTWRLLKTEPGAA